MNYSQYYKARNIVTEIIKKDLLGPVEENEILCGERPLEYYILGKLYPRDNMSMGYSSSANEDSKELIEEDVISYINERNPSSFGLSFSIYNEVEEIIIKSKAAKYNIIDRNLAKDHLKFEDNKYSENTIFWQRTEINFDDIVIVVNDLIVGKALNIEIQNNLAINVLLHKIYDDGSKTITVTMINNHISSEDYNENCLKSVFQPEILISSKQKNSFSDIRRNVHVSQNIEIEELSLLYRRVHDYASGHGCAVTWEINPDTEIMELKTEFLPEYELIQMMPSSRFDHKVLGMKYLAESTKNDVIDGLKEFYISYSSWIEKIENDSKKLSTQYIDAAKRNVIRCRSTLNVIDKSISALNNPDVFKAFSLANKAMFEQRKKMLNNIGKLENDVEIKWYPFQLAFFLQEIYSFANPLSDERKKVDLLWFPTGGGKTEAYLGIAAFVIFLRRIKNGINSDGVTVLMRYTLRLLSIQQFERASALICACEIIRRNQNIEGGEISIGLWGGEKLTPNKLSRADKILNSDNDEEFGESNPALLKNCPWCGSILTKKNYICDFSKKRMYIKCNNNNCNFKDGLPIYLIDEEIYEHMPTFIISTVDKFAQLTLNSDTSSIFGIGKNKLPPELIIQDELHLISGPLGTIIGLYEAAMKKLCEYNGHYAKIVASTATIRNAKEQINALYASDFTQFPPQGIDINDSFFAELSNRDSKPARLYLGCMATGTSPTTMMIRVMSSILYATRYLSQIGFEDKVVDSFWTITGYFNTLRELGGAIIRVIDDIQDRFNYLRGGKFIKVYPLGNVTKSYDKYLELTSREKSQNIGSIIQNELKVQYKSDNSTEPYDFLLSSNMISVGVDVARLGIMTVVGQPKTTSEYIQSTSRVGRETPGLVVATYNQAKSRDRSHYEDFTQYHSKFYKFVESTSVTPFSKQARDRALQALYVILCRNLIPDLSKDCDAIKYNKNIYELNKIREYIISHVNVVDKDEVENVIKDIDDIELAWENKCYRRNELKYKKTSNSSQDDALLEPDVNEYSRFRILNSMRSVEASVMVKVKE